MTKFGEVMEQQSPSYIAEKEAKLHNHFPAWLNSFSPILHISTYDSGTPFQTSKLFLEVFTKEKWNYIHLIEIKLY